MPTIRTTFAGLPVEVDYVWSRDDADYVINEVWVDMGRFVDCNTISLLDLYDHLDQLAAEARPQWDLDAKRDAVERRHER
jgi:hypothetical protein